MRLRLLDLGVFLLEQYPKKDTVKDLFKIEELPDGKLTSIGFDIDKNDGNINFYHSGNIAGHKCILIINLEKNVVGAYNTDTLNHVKIIWDLLGI
ncbi:MAG: hypothetical protein GY909_01720 [Oligoflexia bacterium]|nr:hypothetical protein [Oligoflexia bacterium]